MARRPDSIPEARRAMNDALRTLNSKEVPEHTYCQDRPVPFSEVRQTPEEAAKLCKRGEEGECKLLALCEPLGFTESVYADDMVYGGMTWRRGLPVVSETAYQAKRAKSELRKLPSRITNGML